MKTKAVKTMAAVALSILVNHLCAQQAQSGIYYEQYYNATCQRCLDIRVDPFYYDWLPSQVELAGEIIYRDPVSQIGAGLDAERFWGELSAPNLSLTVCNVAVGRYEVTVFRESEDQECEDTFVIPVEERLTETLTEGFVSGPSGCSYAGATLPAPHDNQLVSWYHQGEYSIAELSARNFLAFINHDERNFSRDHFLGFETEKYPPGLYTALVSTGCGGNARYYQTYPCELSAEVGFASIEPPSSCGSDDGSLRLRGVQICHPNLGDTKVYLLASDGRRFDGSAYGAFLGLPADTYELWVESEFGCSTVAGTYVIMPEGGLQAEVDRIVRPCPSGEDGEVDIAVYHEGATYDLEHAFGSRLSLLERGEEVDLYRIVDLVAGSYELIVRTGEYCEQPLTWRLEEDAPPPGNRFDVWFNPVRACEEQGEYIITGGVVWGTPPYDVTWDDGLYQEGVRSGVLTRRVSVSGTYCATITDRCGRVSSSSCAVVEVLTEATIGELSRADCRDYYDYVFDFQKMVSFGVELVAHSREGGVPLDVDPIRTRSLRMFGGEVHNLRFLTRTGCEVFTTVAVPDVAPRVSAEPSCAGLENGYVSFTFRNADPSEAHELIFEGEPLVLTDDARGHLSGAVGSLATPASYRYTYRVGDCEGSDFVRITGDATRNAYVAHDEDTETCTYQLMCQGEPVDVETTGPLIERPSDSKNPCEANLYCQTERVGDRRVRKRTTTSGIYNQLLQYTLSAGLRIPGYAPGGRDWTTLGPSPCNRVRYCPANMRITSRYKTALGDGRGVTFDGTCYEHDCPIDDSEACLEGSHIPEGAVGNGYIPPSAENCTVVQVTAKQLAIWHDRLLLERPDYDVPRAYRTLHDAAIDIFTRYGSAARRVPQTISTGSGVQANSDPLFCAKIQFCREDFRVVYEDDLTDETRLCGEPVQTPSGSISPYCNGPIAGSDFTACEGGDGFNGIRVACRLRTVERDEGGRFVHVDRAITDYLSLCYPEEVFDLTVPFVDTEEPNALTIPPYFAETRHAQFIDVFDERGQSLRQKALNRFGRYTSYSHSFPFQGQMDQELTEATHSAEYLTERDAYIVSVQPLELGERGFVVTRDDVIERSPVLAHVEGESIQGFAAGRDYVVAATLPPVGELSQLRFLRIGTDTLNSSTEAFAFAEPIHTFSLASVSGEAVAWSIGADGRPHRVLFGGAHAGASAVGAPIELADTLMPAVDDLNTVLVASVARDGGREFSVLEAEAGQVSGRLSFTLEGPAEPFVRLVRRVDGMSELVIAGAQALSQGDVAITVDPGRAYYVWVSDAALYVDDLGIDLAGIELHDLAYSDYSALTFAGQVAPEGLASVPDLKVSNSSAYAQSFLFSVAVPTAPAKLGSDPDDRAVLSRQSSGVRALAGAPVPEWSIYPTVSEGAVRLRVSNTTLIQAAPVLELEVVDATGRRVRSLTVELQRGGAGVLSGSVDLSGLPPGVYTLGTVYKGCCALPAKRVVLAK